MNTLIKLSWRNIWRNKRRTYITAASILFAVLLASFMQSIQTGAWDRMVDSIVTSYFGYAQVHQTGYWEDQSLEKAFPYNASIKDLPQEVEGLEGFVPRLASFALASYGLQTKGVFVIGTDPKAENNMTHLADKLVEGRYFDENENAALIVEGVAQKLKMGVGDTLVLISQGYHGVNAAGKYVVSGILHFPSPQLNKQMVFLPLPAAQYFYGAEGLVTMLSMDINNKEVLPKTVQGVKTSLGVEYDVMDWKELLPELLEARAVDDAGNYLVMMILYIIIAFGIFGTILMMTKEREYEFGILIAIGMKRWKLGIIVWLEIVMLGLLGAFLGILASMPVVGYFVTHPIDFTEMSENMAQAYEKFGFEPIFPAAFEWQIFLTHAVVVFLLTTILAIYPLLKIRKLKPVEAMRA